MKVMAVTLELLPPNMSVSRSTGRSDGEGTTVF